MFLRFYVFLFLLIPVFTHAEYAPYIGTTSLPIMHPKFPCEQNARILDASPKPAVQVLWGTFGEEKACLSSTIRRMSNRPHLVSFALSNEACRRNKRCREGEFFPRDSVGGYERRLRRMDRSTQAGIARRVSDIRALVTELAPLSGFNGRYMLTLGLEDNLSCTAATRLYREVKKHWPHELIRNPLNYQRCRTLRIPYELHYDPPGFWGEDVVSLDGWAFNQKEIATWYALATELQVPFIYFWRPAWQGIKGAKFIDPRKRTFSIPNSDVALIKSLISSQSPFIP